MNLSEMLNIGLMQGFAGLSLFAVLLLMGLGLAIIFGQMGVINMAHGEFMTIGAYTVFMFSTLAESMAPGLMPYYFPVSIVAAFVFAFALGWVVEWGLIRHLYKRPLDTLLATWGLSLGLQQVFRSGIGPKEVSPTLPEWLMGSWSPHEGLDIPINGLFVLALALVVTIQALIFADGGLTVLGANVFNMAVLGAGLGGLLRLELLKKLPAGGTWSWAATALASWAAVMLAALACAVELALAGVLPLEQVVPALLGVHALIGVGEALITCAALALFDQSATVGAVPAARSFAAPTLAAVLIALCLSPFASPLPDGLEAVMAQYQVWRQSAPLFVTLLADYQVAGVASEALSTSLAGLIGAVLTFLAAGMLAIPLTRARTA